MDKTLTVQLPEVNAAETILKALLICKSSDGRETVNISRSRRQSFEVVASAKALGVKTFDIPESK